VVVEKPFVPTAKEAEELVALAKEKGVLITVYQSLLYLFSLLPFSESF
jgi:scyllo-inositol 2-dehydrogenase (NADP+)